MYGLGRAKCSGKGDMLRKEVVGRPQNFYQVDLRFVTNIISERVVNVPCNFITLTATAFFLVLLFYRITFIVQH